MYLIWNMVNEKWMDRACFSYFRNMSHPEKEHKIRFRNDLDKVKNKNVSTSEWITFVINKLRMKDVPISFKVEPEYYYVTVDMSATNYAYLLSLLTLLRYPGEYYQFCLNTFELKEKFPDIGDWDAVFLAHQGYFNDFTTKYNSVIPRSGYGHQLFVSGQRHIDFNPEKSISYLKNLPTWEETDHNCNTLIQPIWCACKYSAHIIFDGKTLEEIKESTCKKI